MPEAAVSIQAEPGRASVERITSSEGAARFGFRYPRQFVDSVRSLAGDCLSIPEFPSARALESGVVRPDAKPGSWLWDPAFVKALRAYIEPRGCLAETPDVADMLFGLGLHALVGLDHDLPQAVRNVMERFIRRNVVRDACMNDGAAEGLRVAMSAYATVMAHVDGRSRFAIRGMAQVQESFARLRRMTDDHPLVRYGLMPSPGDFPEPVAVMPGRGGDLLENVAKAHGFPLPADTNAYVDRNLFAVWENGLPLMVVHRNGRERSDALEALFRTEAFGGLGSMRAAVRRNECEVFGIAPDAVFEAKPVKAPRRRLS